MQEYELLIKEMQGAHFAPGNQICIRYFEKVNNSKLLCLPKNDNCSFLFDVVNFAMKTTICD